MAKVGPTDGVAGLAGPLATGAPPGADGGPSFYRQVLDTLSEGVYFVDPGRRIQFWNRGAARLSGYAADELLGRRCYDNILAHVDEAGRTLCLTACPLAASIADGEPRAARVFLRHRDGHRVPVTVRTSAMRDADGLIVGGVEVFDDDTAGRAADEEHARLRDEARADPLTGLANRRHAEAVIRSRLADVRERGWSMGLLLIDADHFKAVNDVGGHALGDSALRTIGRTLAAGLRASDVAARWGGDEFLAVVAPITPAALRQLAERVRVLVAASRVALPDGEAAAVRVSVGVTMAAAGDDVTRLLARADTALYRAKAEGRDRVVVLEPDAQAAATSRLDASC
ncbi:MAG TPA: GGDEF domain-containing protein [Candidatus Limnocylindrales bacterium]